MKKWENVGRETLVIEVKGEDPIARIRSEEEKLQEERRKLEEEQQRLMHEANRLEEEKRKFEVRIGRIWSAMYIGWLHNTDIKLLEFICIIEGIRLGSNTS